MCIKHCSDDLKSVLLSSLDQNSAFNKKNVGEMVGFFLLHVKVFQISCCQCVHHCIDGRLIWVADLVLVLVGHDVRLADFVQSEKTTEIS